MAFQSTGDATVAQRSLTVPRSAVHQQEGRDVVWVVRKGRVERRAVTVGAIRGDELVIAAGVSGGDRVVVGGPDSLADGAGVVEAQ